MAGIPKNKLHWFIAGFLFLLLVMLSLLSDGYYGGADNISHYLISRYAFRHPNLFLYAWGRPLYTILSAPFAQFGLPWVKLLNVLLGVMTALVTFRIAGLLKIKQPYLVTIFVCFTPLYFMMMPTALTEILFSFVLVLSVFLYLRSNFIASALVISFLPFARTEGFILLPMFLLALLWARQYRAIPFLAAGVLFFSLLGCFYYRDIFWVITQFPYPVNYHHPIYNKAGSLWHFLESRDDTLGWPLELLFLGGMATMVFELFSRDKQVRHRVHFLIILVLGPFLLYLAFHSVLYWKAMGGSLGLDRVLAAVMPLAALVALKGYAALENMMGQNRYVQGVFMTMVVAMVVVTPFMKNKIPFPLSPEEKTIREAAGWVNTSPCAGRLVYYTDNNVPYYLGTDPWQKHSARCVLFGDAKYLDTIPAGSLLVWDAHFGANESKVPVDSLLANRHLQVIRYFRPGQPWFTFGGYFYDCYVALALPPGKTADNYAIRDSLRESLDANDHLATIYRNSFENQGDLPNPACISSAIVHRGRMAYRMDALTEFSPGICQPVSSLPQNSSYNRIRVSLFVNVPAATADQKTMLVISFEHRNKPYSYTAVNLNDLKLRNGKWDRVTLDADIPAFFSPQDLLKVYIWNPAKQVFYMDDMQVDLVRKGH